jgi:FKBP12-rapamycin complex-associated protein
LALKVLGNFDFSGQSLQYGIREVTDVSNRSGHTLNEFVRDAALPFLEHDSPDVRKEAVLASTQLFISDPICQQTSSHSIEIVSDVLEKLLIVAITDPSKLMIGARFT